MKIYNFIFKNISVVIVVVIAFVASCIVGCQQEEDMTFPISGQNIEIVTDDFSLFEKYFASELSSNKSDLKIIGYNIYYFNNKEEQLLFKQMVDEHIDEMRELNMVIATDYSSYRIYFPLHTAIVEYEGQKYNANEKGIVSIKNMPDISKIKVIGRQRSDKVRGTGSNTIKGNTILLRNALKSENKPKLKSGYYQENNICIFDMNANNTCCNKMSNCSPRLKSGNENGKVGCMQNHGGVNCSAAYNINQGGCPNLPSNECIDFNGFWPHCDDHSSLLGFPGSDCGVAVSRGYCWNEIM